MSGYRMIRREFYHDLCVRCGALVADTKAHDRFHADIDTAGNGAG